METSLRLGGDSKALRIHAKEKFPIDSGVHLQAHGEIDTSTGAPSYLALIVRNSYPELSASVGVGVQLNKRSKVGYTIRGKKAFPISYDGLVGINVKGMYDVDKDLKKMKQRGAVEFAWSIFNFKKDQDVRIKLGYEVFDKMPYFQVRENNWTLNADISGKWNVRFDM
ncbi:outer envelope pore protein 21B, chloroplastic isoform X2 [Phoenix dactylifera]|uniref:Outer envelope pore protein 21B, chloroplastic isoform X2 n=1 Tax=Phoenix dactylifera TaxID=42345 RepID=A0A8B8ZIN8_PHODC|nr:outer envelope pore protein 21B, chloroplastic isoform X2 [Phoenix dactylifera]